jgi:HAD superfamily hydrolase (TIGR01509 family)
LPVGRAVIGEEWRGAFDILLTRDNTPFVKPDKRCLLHFAHAWGLQPWELLMVGDSQEDIETACAAGTASCLIAGELSWHIKQGKPCG